MYHLHTTELICWLFSYVFIFCCPPYSRFMVEPNIRNKKKNRVIGTRTGFLDAGVYLQERTWRAASWVLFTEHCSCRFGRLRVLNQLVGASLISLRLWYTNRPQWIVQYWLWDSTPETSQIADTCNREVTLKRLCKIYICLILQMSKVAWSTYW